MSEVSWLFAYTQWADDRTFSSVESLTDEQFARVLGGSFPTIRDTTAHIVAAEWVWLERWKGSSPTAYPDWIRQPTVASLRAKLGEVEAERAGYLRSLGDADLRRPLTYTRFNGEVGSLPLEHLFRHVVNHSTYHRGQIATMIRQAGGTPIGTDLLNFTG